MKKIIYILLLFITITLFGYTGYYAKTHSTTAQTSTVVATSTIATASETPVTKKILITSTGKKINLEETNPAGQSLSTITITEEGFATNTPIILEKNKLTDSFLADLDHDSYDELVIITTSAGSGNYGEATIYTTRGDKELIPVTVPQLREEDTKKGGLFEGYMGHDSFVANNGTLIREFPVYTAQDTNSNPTGGTKKIIYSLNTKDGVYAITFTNEEYLPVSTSTPTTASSSRASTTPQKTAPAKKP